jgi:TonB family protein
MRKLTISTRLSTALSIILTFYAACFSQIETNSVPAKWEYYSGRDKKVSFLMPRLPVYMPGGSECSGESGEVYAAYNDGVVYRLDIISKIEPPKLCFQRQDFDQNSFVRRAAAIKSELKDKSNSQNNISKDSVIKVVGDLKITKLINDYDNKRWFELSVYGATETKTEVKNFLAWSKTDAQPPGIAIGEGATQTFGDAVPANESEVRLLQNIIAVDGVENEELATEIIVKIKDPTTRNFFSVLKPRAGYTDAARRKKVQGKVELRVTFMANGAIGAVSVVRGLPDGLTEEAVKAAHKLVFIPPQKNGERYTVSKPVEYSFSIF